MIHFFKHLFGMCGEAHPNIFTILLGATGAHQAFSFIKFKIKTHARKINGGSYYYISYLLHQKFIKII